jgi:hypothetical protein
MLFSFLAVLPGNGLNDAKTDEQSRGKCQENGPGIERNAVERGWIRHIRVFLGLMAMDAWFRELWASTGLATTTGGEPVRENACLIRGVHAMDSSTDRKREQGQSTASHGFPVVCQVGETEAAFQSGKWLLMKDFSFLELGRR